MAGRSALAGAASFVLILISAVLRSNEPSATDSAQRIVSYLALHHGRPREGSGQWRPGR